MTSQTSQIDATLRALSDLVGQVAQTLRAEDDTAARTRAASQVDQLCDLIAGLDAGLDRAPLPGIAAMLDLAQVREALRRFADSLRAPTGEAGAERTISDLQAMLGPLAGRAPVHDDARERERYRQQASAAIDEYFRDHPIKLKP